MTIYTYVVDHKDNPPAISAGDTIGGGLLTAVAFYDAMARLEIAEELLTDIIATTDNRTTKHKIQQFLEAPLRG